MSRLLRVSLGVAAALALIGLLGVGLRARIDPSDTAASANPMQGRPAPPLAGSTLAGGHLDLHSLAGRIVVVNIWASWCGPCQDELPVLAAAQRQYAARGVRFVGLDTRDGPVAARALLAQVGFTGLTSVLDPQGRQAITWGATGVPETFVVGPDQTIRAHRAGPVTAAWLARTLDPLLTAGAPR